MAGLSWLAVPRYVSWVPAWCPGCSDFRPVRLTRDVTRPDGMHEIGFMCLTCLANVITRSGSRDAWEGPAWRW